MDPNINQINPKIVNLKQQKGINKKIISTTFKFFDDFNLKIISAFNTDVNKADK